MFIFYLITKNDRNKLFNYNAIIKMLENSENSSISTKRNSHKVITIIARRANIVQTLQLTLYTTIKMESHNLIEKCNEHKMSNIALVVLNYEHLKFYCTSFC